MKKVYRLRRNRQRLSDEVCSEILQNATSGVLSLIGEDGYPYAVPLSYVWKNGKFYFHMATKGEKIDAIRHCNRTSFCVIFKDEVVPSRYTTRYQSVVSFGTIRIVSESAEQMQALRWFAEKYSPGESGFDKEVEEARGHLIVACMDVELMTGKQGLEFLKQEIKKEI